MGQGGEVVVTLVEDGEMGVSFDSFYALLYTLSFLPFSGHPSMALPIRLLALSALITLLFASTTLAQFGHFGRGQQFWRHEAAMNPERHDTMQYRALTNEEDVAELVGRGHHDARAHKKHKQEAKDDGDDDGENPVRDAALDYSLLDAAFADGLKEFKGPRKNDTMLDLTKLVDPFIGTRGNSNPGAFESAAESW